MKRASSTRRLNGKTLALYEAAEKAGTLTAEQAAALAGHREIEADGSRTRRVDLLICESVMEPDLLSLCTLEGGKSGSIRQALVDAGFKPGDRVVLLGKALAPSAKPTDEQPAPAAERPDLPAVWDLVLADVYHRYPPPPCFELDVAKSYVLVLRLAQGVGAALGANTLDDMRERDALGRQRYGTPLQPHNGRKALVDAYQELLDAVVYLRQHLYEQEPGWRP